MIAPKLFLPLLVAMSASACAGAPASPAQSPAQNYAPTFAAAPSSAELEAPTVDRMTLQERRRGFVAQLEAYIAAGEFPVNDTEREEANLFKDKDGHLCAVANLIHLDGHTELVDKTAAENNFIVLAEVTAGPLHHWILGSGFTQEEIADIQRPYRRIDAAVAPIELEVAVDRERKRLRGSSPRWSGA